jgi:hypothetical protein
MLYPLALSELKISKTVASFYGWANFFRVTKLAQVKKWLDAYDLGAKSNF